MYFSFRQEKPMLYETGTRGTGVGGAVGSGSPKGISIPPTDVAGAIVVGVILGCPGVTVGGDVFGAVAGGRIAPGTVDVALLLGAVTFVETAASEVGGPGSGLVAGEEDVVVAVGAPGGNDVFVAAGDAPSGVVVESPGTATLVGAVVAIVFGPDVAPGARELFPGADVVDGGLLGALVPETVAGAVVVDA
jgi:hypothetical protein